MTLREQTHTQKGLRKSLEWPSISASQKTNLSCAYAFRESTVNQNEKL